MKLIEPILAQAAAITQLRRDIHAHPELCYEEVRTADLVAAKVFAEGLRRAARPSREGLIAALEGINEDFGGYRVNFGAGQHVASRFVELSMLTGDGRIRT